MGFEAAQIAAGVAKINDKSAANGKMCLGFIVWNFNQTRRATQFRVPNCS